MKKKNYRELPDETVAASWKECNRRINEKYIGRRTSSTTTNKFEDGIMHSETVIVHKQTSTVGVILLTAVVFLLIGALIAGGVATANFVSADVFAGKPSNATPMPLNTPNPNYNQGNQGNPGGSINFNSSPMTDIYNRSVNGVVLIKSYDKKNAANMDLAGMGTGFFLTANGYILTNAHVVGDAKAVKVELYDGTILDATIVGRDNRTDIAVLRVEGEGYNALPIGNSDESEIGEFVMTIGHPTGEQLGFTATFGIIGSVNRRVNIDGITNEYIQIDAAINPGNSGGPLFDMSGNVIGINSAKTVAAGYDESGEVISADGLGFAFPINKAIRVAEEIIRNNGSVARAGIGMSVIAIEAERAEYYNIPQGMLVYTIIKDGPAHKAGLYADDIITKIAGKPILTTDEFSDTVLSYNVGDPIEVEFWRDGELKTCTIIAGNFNELGEEILDNAYGGEKYGIK